MIFIPICIFLCNWLLIEHKILTGTIKNLPLLFCDLFVSKTMLIRGSYGLLHTCWLIRLVIIGQICPHLFAHHSEGLFVPTADRINLSITCTLRSRMFISMAKREYSAARHFCQYLSPANPQTNSPALCKC